MTEAAPPRPLQMGAKGAYIVRLLMVGDSSCGKTSLVLRFDQNVFSTKFVTTIGVDYRDKMVKVRYMVVGMRSVCKALGGRWVGETSSSGGTVVCIVELRGSQRRRRRRNSTARVQSLSRVLYEKATV